MTVHQRSHDTSFATRAPGPKGRDKLRGAMIRLSLAALLVACAVFEVFGIVKTVADGSASIGRASQTVHILQDLQSLSTGFEAVVVGLEPREALARVSEHETVIRESLAEIDRLTRGAYGGEGDSRMLQYSDAMIADARSMIFERSNVSGLAGLQSEIASFQSALRQALAEQGEISQQGFGSLVAETKFSVVMLFVFLAASVFFLSTVLITGFREVQRRELVEDELRDAVQRADDANKAKSRFLATMTHEIRTPLNAILGFSELLGKEQLSPDQKQQVNRLNSAGRTLSRIVDDVLDLTRIELDGLELRDEAFSPAELFREAIDLVSVHSQAKGLVLASEITNELPRALKGDPLRLSQVLLNLLNNAIKFTPEGCVTLRVSTQKMSDDLSRLRIEVQDTGIGICETDRKRLFTRFTQCENGVQAQAQGGSGLGLAISQGLVRQMGGEIQVHSQLGKGTTFWFYLNLPVLDAKTDLPVAVPELSVLNVEAERVMLIDDSEDTGDLVRRILSREGVQVEVIRNPNDAMRQIIAGDPDVVLCDMQMPEVSGAELTRHIRALPQPFGDVPIIAFSATSLPEEIEEMMLAGANAFLAKPFQVNDLVAAISGVLTDARSEKPENHSSQAINNCDELEQMVALMGQDWVLKFLNRLTDRLRSSFEPKQSRASRIELAHRVVAEAGQLGEKDLSNAAAALERGLRAGENTSRIEARFNNEARAFLSRVPLFTSRIRHDH